VGKTVKEITEAIQAGILMLNVESEQELERINLIGGTLNKRIPIAIRVNPLYGGYHHIIPVRKKTDETMETDIVGPICESTDFLAKERLIERIHPDDLLAVTDAGAYGIVLASHYNSHAMPVEVLVDGNEYKMIRRRETYEDLLHSEID
jgi:diaminopimelate decarboxylase